MNIDSFVGPSNVLSSTLEDCELSINLRPEGGQVGKPKRPGWLQRTPGLAWLFSVGSSYVTELYEINERMFGISGTVFFEVDDDLNVTVRGSVAAATGPFPKATMCSNGSAGDQLFITSGGNGYIFTLSTNAGPTIIADLDFPNGSAMMGEFFAGYFFVQVEGSRRIQWSALEDGTAWDALDVFERSWASDNISFIKRLGTHIWVVGNQTSEVLYATGDETVFAPAQESLIEHGCVAEFSGCRASYNDTEVLIWLDQSERGGGQVVVAKGLQPGNISTYAIALEQQLQADQMTNAVGFAIQLDGHVDYVLNNDTGTYRLTPVFDVSEGLWHHRAGWNSTTVQWEPWRANCHVYAFQRHLIGDRLTGAVYELAMDNLTDELADVA